MARKPICRDLPALRTVLPHFKGFAEDAHHLESVVSCLRGIIEKVRSQETRPFYAQRELAGFLRVPLRTVALAYKRLQAEGLLSIVRGSATFVPSRKRQPRQAVRGVVGIATWETGFTDLRHQREFYRELEQALRGYNYVADFLFFEGAVRGTDFAERLLEHHLDYLIWLDPLPESVEVIHTLADGGVRPLLVGNGQQYQRSNIAAFVQALKAWRHEGIVEIAWVCDNHDQPPLPEDLRHLLARLEFRWRSFPMPPDSMEEYLAGLPSGPKAGIIFPSDILSSIICRFHQSAMFSLLRRVRVLLTESLPVGQAAMDDAQVDLIRSDWTGLARRIASDIAADPVGNPSVFHARWLPRQSAAQLIKRSWA